jgi:prophage endopeptidase
MKILAGICAALAIGLLLALWRIDHISSSLAEASDQVTTLTNAATSRRNTQRLLADLDTQHTRELTNAQTVNNQLRADVASGARRLSIAATCPAVRATTSTAGLADAEARADIDPAAAQRIVAITNDGDEAIIALSALQDYVTTTCLPRK